jgi:hypothetical protein
MGSDNTRNNNLNRVGTDASNAYTQLNSGPSPLTNQLGTNSNQMWTNYNNSTAQQGQDYTRLMGGYQNFASGMAAPRNYSAQQVSVIRPEELNQAYGYLNEAAPGYRTFAETGGYSPQDIQELRARGSAPITSAYSNAQMEINRARAIGGAGGSPNYIAAMARMQRELPGQLSTATTGVNAALADAIRQGKLSGLAGLTGIGTQMGGLASADSSRQLSAGIANQGADLQAQGLTQQALNNYNQMQLAALNGQSGLYGTTPGMASMFGNQALSAQGQQLTGQGQNQQYGLGLLNSQNQSYGGNSTPTPWWQSVLGGMGSAAPYAAQMLGGGGSTAPDTTYDYSGTDWGGWQGGDMTSFNNYWNDPDNGRVTGSGLGGYWQGPMPNNTNNNNSNDSGWNYNPGWMTWTNPYYPTS